MIWAWLETVSLPGFLGRPARIVVNLAGAAGAALFAQASLQFYLSTHSLIGVAFLIEQTWFVIAFLVRRTPSAVSRDPGSWLLAFGGTFAGVLFRPVRAPIRTGELPLGWACSWPASPSATVRPRPSTLRMAT